MTRAAGELPAESWLTIETQGTVVREGPMMGGGRGGRHGREVPFRAPSLSGLTLSLPARTFLEEGTGVQQRVRTRAGFKSQTWSKVMTLIPGFPQPLEFHFTTGAKNYTESS